MLVLTMFCFCLGHKALTGVMHLTIPFPYVNISTSTFEEDHSGDGVLETYGVLSKYLAFREAVHCLEVGDPAHMSYGFEITKGSLTWERKHTDEKQLRGKALN